jgi:hypothetical protein
MGDVVPRIAAETILASRQLAQSISSAHLAESLARNLPLRSFAL